MRASLGLAALLLTALLAGCSGQATPPSDDAPTVGGPSQDPSGPGALARMRFDAPDFNVTRTFDGTFPNPDPCGLGLHCQTPPLRFELTDLVPVDAPVELTIAIDSDACTGFFLDNEDTRFYRSKWDQDGIAALVVREPAGTLALEVATCNVLTGMPEGPVPVTVEVRSVVRPGLLAAFMPVVVPLAPGDRIQAMGDGAADIEDLVVVPPGGAPIHVLEGAAFNVTPGLPTGDYVVMVKGGDGMLHGPNVTLRPARLEFAVGEDRAVPSGQPLAWSVEVPGTPVLAVLYFVTGTYGGVEEVEASYDNAYTIAIRQGGATLATVEQPSCVVPCHVIGPGGQMARGTGTGFMPEGLGLGALEFSVINDMAEGVHAYEVVGYLAA